MIREPVSRHNGPITVQSTWVGATDGTLSTGDIVQFFKVPDRAKILDGFVFCGTSDGDLIFSLGASALVTSSASGRLNFLPTQIGSVVSITASDYPKYKVLQATLASASYVGTIKVSLTYTMDHQDNT
jgi:hypothetical protein